MAAALAAPAWIPADEMPARIQKVAKEREGILARMKAVLSIHISAGEQESTQEARTEFDIAALDGNGLYVGCEPKGLVNVQVPAGVTIEVKGDQFTVVLPDGKEAEARLEGVDPETGLGFYRTAKPVAPAASLAGAKGRKLSLGDSVLILSRLSNANPVVTAVLSRIRFVLEKPSPHFGLHVEDPGSVSPGMTAFDLDGSPVGVVGLYREEGIGRAYQVVIPAERVLKLASDLKPPAEEK